MSKNNVSYLIGSAVASVTIVASLVKEGKLLTQDEADQLHALLQQTIRLRNTMIQYELKAGIPGKEVAKRYGLTAARITQIKDMVL
jgi:hypothetical protein